MRVGLIGCGAIGVLRAEALLQKPAFRLVSVADTDFARAQKFAARFNSSADQNWQAVVNRNDVDAIMVSTPPASHAEISIAAMKAGKHVLCEKPLARTPDECGTMLAAAKQTGKLLATGFNYRFYPSVMKAREFFDAGVIGEMDHVRAYTGYSATAHHQSWLHEKEAMGGGSLRDNGIHLIDTMLYFFGDPVEVQGAASADVWKFPGCEDNGFAIIRNAKGNIGSIHASWTEWAGYRFSIEIYGSRGCIKIRCFPMITEVIHGDAKAGKTSRQRFFFPRVHFMEHLKGYQWIVVQSFIREFDEFRLAVEGKKSAIATDHDGWRAVDLAHRACLNSKLL